MGDSEEPTRSADAPGPFGDNPFRAGHFRPVSAASVSLDTRPLRFQYSLGSILMLTTLVAVLLSIGTMNWGLALVLAIFAFPALLRTSVTAAWRRSSGYPMAPGEKTTLFFTSMLGGVLVATAVAATFFGTCFVGFLAGAAVANTAGIRGNYDDLGLGLSVGMVVGGIAGLVTLFFVGRFALRTGRKTQIQKLDMLRSSSCDPGPQPIHPRNAGPQDQLS